MLLTNNDVTEKVFNDATANKSQRKKTKQVYLNFNDINNKEAENNGYSSEDS